MKGSSSWYLQCKTTTSKITPQKKPNKQETIASEKSNDKFYQPPRCKSEKGEFAAKHFLTA